MSTQRQRVGVRPEFSEHLPYVIQEDRTYARLHYRWECPCGDRGGYHADVERAHDGHREHVAKQLRRCPRCMEPLGREAGEDGGEVLVCFTCRRIV